MAPMNTCISRRACADRDDFRLTNDMGQIGKHIWIEYRCPNVVSEENMVCQTCSYKIPKYKYQANPKCDHGIVGGPYPADSKLYGSAFYLKQLENGWYPTKEDENRAKEAVNKACMGKKKEGAILQAVEMNIENTVKPEVTLEPLVKPKRKYTKKAPGESKSRKSKVKEDITLPTPPPVQEINYDPKFIETTDAPIHITNVVVVKIKKIKCQGKDYYLDSISGKVYGISVNGVGSYKGRYKEEDVIDTTFPDSDCE